jgi:hypothetical protein
MIYLSMISAEDAAGRSHTDIPFQVTLIVYESVSYMHAGKLTVRTALSHFKYELGNNVDKGCRARCPNKSI